MDKITRREMLGRLAFGAAGFALLMSGLPSCSPRSKHPDQSILKNGCNGCGKCRCPYGIAIADNLTFYDEQAEAGYLPDPREAGTSRYEKESRDYLVRLNRKIPRLAQSDRCIGCHQCKCDEKGIDILLALRQMEQLTEKVKETVLL